MSVLAPARPALASTLFDATLVGTYQCKGESAYRATLAALHFGYRHIDTAAVYVNEEHVGQAIRNSGVPRKDIFVTSKLGPKDHGYENALAAFEATMKRLNLEDNVLDLYLIHWPALTGIPKEDSSHLARRKASWMAFEELYEAGRVRAIGVSNYTVRHLSEMLEYAKVLPFVNQVELHPRLPQRELRAWCERHGIIVEAYSSLGQGKLIDNESVVKIAEKKQKSTAQVLLRWGVQQQLVILPKSSHEERIKANTQLFDWELSKADMAILDALEDGTHFCWDPTDVS